ncbi:MAG: hypothetical protein IJJ42_06975 [Clostridia bacterium]|nr:hypothetical protein [Clostridia bacterium]
MKGIIKAAVILCLIVLLPFSAFADDSYNLNQDGFSTSYSYIYDYWGDVQEAPNPYRVKTVIDTTTIGLEQLGGKAMNKPQSLFVQGQELYVADTVNNRILQIHREGNEFELARIIDTVYGPAGDFAMAEKIQTTKDDYSGTVNVLAATEKKLDDVKTAYSKGPDSEEYEQTIIPMLNAVIAGEDPFASLARPAAPEAVTVEPVAEEEAAAEPAGEEPAEEAPAAEAEAEPAPEAETAAEAETVPEEPAQLDTDLSSQDRDALIQQQIERLTQMAEEARAAEEEAYLAAEKAEEDARTAGCRIWEYDRWSLDADGKAVSAFTAPYDVNVDPEGNIYVADTNGKRILKMDAECNVLLEFTKPIDATFDQTLDFLPKKIVIDVAGRVYALCQNANKGLVKYEADGTFSGFIGANAVTVSMGEYIWKRYFQTKEQRAASAAFVPTEYENIYIDEEGFIYATNTVFDEYDLLYDNAKPIRRLNSLGNDILIKNDRYPPIGDQYWVEQSTQNGPSKFTDITVMGNDIYVALDRTRGRLFAYDSQGVLLWAFGTKGNADGAFNSAVSVEHMGYDLFVLDQLKNSITVFTPTEYGRLIYDANETYMNGEYEKSAEIWGDVMRMNANYPLAYRGIGRAILREEDYEGAMNYFKMAHDRENYGRAFKLYRKVWIEQNILWIVVVLAVLLIVPLVIGRIKRTKWEVIMHEQSKVRQ